MVVMGCYAKRRRREYSCIPRPARLIADGLICLAACSRLRSLPSIREKREHFYYGETLHILRRIASCDPACDASMITASGIPVKVACTQMDIAHPMQTAMATDRELSGEDAATTFTRSLNKSRHSADVTELLKRNIRIMVICIHLATRLHFT